MLDKMKGMAVDKLEELLKVKLFVPLCKLMDTLFGSIGKVVTATAETADEKINKTTSGLIKTIRGNAKTEETNPAPKTDTNQQPEGEEQFSFSFTTDP
jgi:hypothetical protein